MALALPLSAHTGGAVTAALRVEEPAGGAGALNEGCMVPQGPIPPPLSLKQRTAIFHDLDGDGLLDPGDLISYTAEVHNLSPEPFTELHLLVIFSSTLVPVATTGPWEPLELGRITAMAVDLPPLSPGGSARMGFAARFVGGNEVTAVFVQGIVYGDGIALVADDPDTEILLDPAVTAVREVVGSAGSLFPSPSVFSKEAFASALSPRLGDAGGEVEFIVTYTPSVQGEDVEILDLVPAPLRVIPQSLQPEGTEIFPLGDLTILRARFVNVVPGERLTLRYTAVVEGFPRLPFVATHAMAVSGRTAIFSDDPATPEVGDPTPLLFPFTQEARFIEEWADILREGTYVIPVILRLEEGDVLRWAVCGLPGADVMELGELVFLGMARIPLRSPPEDSIFGILSAQGAGEIYVPSVYGAPIFSSLAGGMGTVIELAQEPCGDLYLPVLVGVPTGFPPRMTGVIVDADL